jgi:hypothetical protein
LAFKPLTAKDAKNCREEREENRWHGLKIHSESVLWFRVGEIQDRFYETWDGELFCLNVHW